MESENYFEIEAGAAMPLPLFHGQKRHKKRHKCVSNLNFSVQMFGFLRNEKAREPLKTLDFLGFAGLLKKRRGWDSNPCEKPLFIRLQGTKWHRIRHGCVFLCCFELPFSLIRPEELRLR